MRTWRRTASAAAVALLAGCSGTSPADVPADDDPQLSAVSVYGRHAAVRARVDVRLANEGDRAVDVESLRVEHPLFAPVPVLERRSTLPPDGKARIVPVPFGPARCDVDDPAGARVVVGVRTGDGVREVAVPLADGEPGLVRAHRMACAVERVGEVADVVLDGFAPGSGPVAVGVVRLTRRGAGEVVVASVGSNILFTSEPGPDPLLSLGPDAAAAAAPVRLRAARCDPHALTESKRSFTFPVFVGLDGGEPSRVEVTVTGPDRDVLQDLLDRTCGPAG